MKTWIGITSIFSLLLFNNVAMAVDKISVRGLFTDVAVVNIDGKEYVLKQGETSPEGVTLEKANDQEAWIKVDGKSSRYTIDDTGGYHVAPVKETTVMIPATEDGMYLVEGSINAQSVVFMIDTGASHVAMSQQLADTIGLDYKKSGVVVQADTASGTHQAYAMRIAEVKVGNIVVRNVAALILPGALPKNPLLGMSFLENLEMENKGSLLQLRQKF